MRHAPDARRYYAAGSKPLYVTEFGTNDMTSQGDFPAHMFAALAANDPHVAAIWWFCWSDAMVAPFGVVDTSGKPKPSYSSYETYAHSH